MRARPDFSLEDACAGSVCGIDEVGVGPLAGPVVAAAVILQRDKMPAALLEQINDSKKLTAARRACLFDKIHGCAEVSIAQVSVTEIDRLNILQASLQAMTAAFRGLKHRPALALVDGNKAPRLPACQVKTVIKGDSLSLSIAAASVVAKHYRDLLMAELAHDFPHYGWENNAGYGTAGHLKAIEIHGVTIHHRRTFSPVAKRLVKESSAKN